MSQFDVYRLGDGTLALDLQSNLLDTGMRAMVPLRPLPDEMPRVPRLTPVLGVNGEPHVLRMDELASVPVRLLRTDPVADLSDERDKVRDALDYLFQGF